MRDSDYWLAATGGAATLLVAWFAGTWLHLRGTGLWVLRSGLALLGISAIGAIFTRRREIKQQPAQSGPAKDGQQTPARPGASGDVDSLIREAESNLGGKLPDFRTILVIGPTGSGKSSVVDDSGLEPELQAETPAGRISLGSEKTVLLEVGTASASDSKSWKKLIRAMAPAGIRLLFAKRKQPAKAVVLTLDCRAFVNSQLATRINAIGDETRSRLREAARMLGVRLPVYVLFTRIDDLPCFREYTTNLPNDAIREPFGATLPMDSSGVTGVWKEKQGRVLTKALRDLFFVLAARRLDLMAAESEAVRRRSAFQFPREFRKLARIGVIIQYLLRLSRPYHIGSAPFLRGFYFVGAQEISAAQAAGDSAVDYSQSEGDDVGATYALGDSIPDERPTRQGRVFLSHLVANIVLEDLKLFDERFPSRRVSWGRRVVLACVTAFMLLLALGFWISHSANERLATEALDLGRSVPSRVPALDETVPTRVLERLDLLRLLTNRLKGYEDNGKPWHIDLGLYIGNDIYGDVRQAHLDRFGRLLLDPVRRKLHDYLDGLPASPKGVEEFGPVYEALKAYLEITSNPEKISREFLSPVLLKWWERGQPENSERRRPVKNQFDWFTGDAGPSIGRRDPDGAVAKARQYLQQFAGADAAYQMMVNAASAKHPPITLAALYPQAGDLVVNSYEVPGAFTKAGWTSMQALLRGTSFDTEDWVVVLSRVDREAVARDLSSRYRHDFIKHWSQFLQATHVVACRTRAPRDAASRLTVLSNSQSPLLGLFCTVSQNTDVDSPEVKEVFQPVRSTVPADCQRQPTGDSNNDYVNGLFSVKEALEQASSGQPGSDVHSLVDPRFSAARTAAHQLETRFHVDPEWRIHQTMSRLLNEPISTSEACATGGGDAGPVCAQFTALKSRYPFSAKATTQAAIRDVDAFFNPRSGVLWGFYEQSLRNVLVQRGAEYAPNPLSPRPVRPEFLRFFNRAARVTEVLYRGGVQQPQMQFTLRVNPSPGVDSVTINVDGQPQTFLASQGANKDLIWRGGPQGVELSALLVGGVRPPPRKFEGPWGLYRLFDEMEITRDSGTEVSLEITIRERVSNEPFRDASGNPIKLKVDIGGDAAYFLRKENRGGIECVSRATQ